MQDSKRDTDVKTDFLDSVGEGKGGIIWENSIETYIITTFERDDQSKFDAWNRALNAGALGWWRGMGWGFGTGVIHHTRDWFMSMYGKKKITIL